MSPTLDSLSTAQGWAGGSISHLVIGSDGLPLVVDFLIQPAAVNSTDAAVHYMRATHCSDPACIGYTSVMLDEWPLVGDPCLIFGGVGLSQLGLALFTFYDATSSSIQLARVSGRRLLVHVRQLRVRLSCPARLTEQLHAGRARRVRCLSLVHRYTGAVRRGREQDIRMSVATSVGRTLVYVYILLSSSGLSQSGAVFGGSIVNVSSVTQMVLPSGKSQMLYTRYQWVEVHSYQSKIYSIEMTLSPT